MAWAVQRETEGISSRNIRVSNLRQVSKYLQSIGKESYMPRMLQSGETKIAHVFTAEERKEFFESLNKLNVRKNSKRLLEECRILSACTIAAASGYPSPYGLHGMI